MDMLRRRGFWALTDQAVLSLGTFITSYLLLNYSPTKGDYAIYLLILSTILFLNTLHSSLVTYPLSLKGAVAGPEPFRQLTRQCAGFAAVMVVPLAAALAASVWALGRPELIPFAIAALVLWQLQETLRRAMMAKLRHVQALPGDAISYLGQALGIFILYRTGTLTLQTTLAMVALTSGLAAIVQAVQLGVLSMPRWTPGLLGRLFREHWAYGRWLIVINFMSLITIQAMPWTLKFMHGQHGDEEVAHFGALATLLGVANPVLTSVVGLIVPAVAMSYREGGIIRARRVGRDYAAMGAALLIPYFSLLLLFPGVALSLFTHGHHESYADLALPLRLFVLAYALTYPGQIIAAMLNGLGHSRATLIGQIAFAVVTLTVSLPLAAKFGLIGAVWGGLVPALVFTAVSFWLLRRTISANDLFAPAAQPPPAETKEVTS